MFTPPLTEAHRDSGLHRQLREHTEKAPATGEGAPLTGPTSRLQVLRSNGYNNLIQVSSRSSSLEKKKRKPRFNLPDWLINCI